MITIEDMIVGGTGLYTPSEVARYARMSPITLNRWLSGNESGERVFLVEDCNLLTFADFVQTLAARNLRVIHGLQLKKIRQAVKKCKEEDGIDYPLARRHTTYLFDGELWIDSQKDGPVVVSGRQHGQKGIKLLIEPFMKDVYFDGTTGLANRYHAYQKGEEVILMDPTVRFGEPILANCGYTPEALFEAAKTEGSIEAAARMYGVSTQQVEVCFSYFDYLEAA